MLKIRDEIIPHTEHLHICPLTGDIFDLRTGEVQPTKISRGRICWGSRPVHLIQVCTNSDKWWKGCDVHHVDMNPFNNMLSNLVCLSHAEHSALHAKYRQKSAETKQKIREKCREAIKGRKWWNNSIEQTQAFECPGEGWTHGMLKKSR